MEKWNWMKFNTQLCKNAWWKHKKKLLEWCGLADLCVYVYDFVINHNQKNIILQRTVNSLLKQLHKTRRNSMSSAIQYQVYDASLILLDIFCLVKS